MPKKVIILTLPLENNYGGLLQAYALQKVVSDMGFDVYTDRNACKNKTWKNFFLRFYLPLRYKQLQLCGKKVITPKMRQVQYQKLVRFIDENIKTVDFFKGRDNPRRKDIEKYEVYVVGSDQIWRKKYVRVKSYFLDFLKGKDNICRIAYAASFGTDNIDEWNDEDKKVCGSLIQKFTAISVREKDGVAILKKQFETHATLVLDPTLLLTKEIYNRLDGVEKIPRRNKLLFCYVLDLNEDKKNLINHLKEEYELEQVLFISPKMENIDKNLPVDFVYPSMAEWISGFRDAEFVFTDSFHGTVFSILFNKDFICYANKTRGLSRFESLFESLEINVKLIFNSQDYNKCHPIKIDYTKVNEKLNLLRRDSMSFLSKSLNVK